MHIPRLPFTVTDWSRAPVTEHSGETEMAYWRTLDIGEVRVRLVEYTPGYLADHWCDRGHILSGELDTELKDGRTFKLTPHELSGLDTRRCGTPIIDTNRQRSCSWCTDLVP